MFTKMAKKDLAEKIEIPDGIKVIKEIGYVVFTGPKGVIKQKLSSSKVHVNILDNEIELSSPNSSKKEKAIINTYKIQFKNDFEGVKNGFMYKLKICSSHFPITVAISGNLLQVKNLLGEKVPRQIRIKEGVVVVVDGSFINVTGIDKEKVGQVAGDIEQVTRRPKFDKRVFQDGIYIMEKAGKVV